MIVFGIVAKSIFKCGQY